jgi:lysozyme
MEDIMDHVLGIDVYSLNSPDDKALATNDHQKAANWKAVYEAGVRFAYIKATEYNPDRDFSERMHYAKEAGLLRGPYMLPHFEFSNIAEQVKLFVQTVGSDPGELPPMLDLESPKGNWPKGRLLLNRLKQCLDRIESAFGRKPLIYTSQSIVRDYQITNPPWGNDYDLWVAAYPYADFVHKLQYSDPTQPPRWSSAYPLQPDGYKSWTIWQWTSKGRLSGMQHENVDINMFKGTYTDLLSWANAKAPVRVQSYIDRNEREHISGTPNPIRYVIKPGDALSLIAQNFHTTMEMIMTLNPQITNPKVIMAGDTLNIPQAA